MEEDKDKIKTYLLIYFWF